MAETETRRLAVIMFTDISGYTSLMGEDEKKGMEILARNRAIHKRLAEKYDGQWIKEIGDGTLLSFQSTSAAIHCAAAILDETRKKDINLKIGIHQGDIIFKGKDVFGDGVNVTSRIEELAQPGQILISEAVHRNVANKPGVTARFVGEKELKNVKEAWKLYSIDVDPGFIESVSDGRKSSPKELRTLAKWMVIGFIGITAGIAIWTSLSSKERANTPSGNSEQVHKSIAVLPFTDLSQDKDQGYFTDGMTQEIIIQLNQIRDFDRVASFTSVTPHKNSTKSTKEIAGDLAVNYLLEGSVRKAGDQLLISVTLLDAIQDLTIWTQTFDEALRVENIFDIQKTIALTVVDRLHVNLSEDEARRVGQMRTDNLEAHELLLKGQEQRSGFWSSFNTDHVNKCIATYLEAIQIDPNYSDAYVRLGEAYWYLGHWDTQPKSLYWLESKRALEKAIELDPDNGLAYSNLGVVYSTWDWDTSAARRVFLKSIELSPNDAENYNHYSHFLMRVRDCDELRNVWEKLQEMNHPGHQSFKIRYLYCNRNYERMLEEFVPNDSIPVFTTLPYEWHLWWPSLVETGQYEMALKLAEKIDSLIVWKPMSITFLAIAHFSMEQKDQAMQLLEQLETLSESQHVSKIYFAAIHSWLGEKELAYTLLEEAKAEKDWEIANISWLDYLFLPIREEARFKEVIPW